MLPDDPSKTMKPLNNNSKMKQKRNHENPQLLYVQRPSKILRQFQNQFSLNSSKTSLKSKYTFVWHLQNIETIKNILK